MFDISALWTYLLCAPSPTMDFFKHVSFFNSFKNNQHKFLFQALEFFCAFRIFNIFINMVKDIFVPKMDPS
jgi:hypothetical protein